MPAPAVETAAKTGKTVPEGYQEGGVVPFQPITGPAVWYAADFKDVNSLFYVLSESDLKELDAAVASVLEGGKNIQEVTLSDFVLPTLGPKLKEFGEEARAGRGFVLIRGVPVDRYSRKESIIAYWGFGLYWGKAVSQNKKGHLVGHIKDIGHDPSLPTTRLYATHEAQPYHNDAADLVSLLCLKNAKEGGLSSWSSSLTVHNEILKRRPDLAPIFAGPWFFDRKGEVPAGKQGFFKLPVFNYLEGYLSVNYSDNYYILSQRHEEVPRLTPDHYAAMALFNELAKSDELRLDAKLEPGDIQLISNHHILHSRTAFVDHPEFDNRRHLLRLWLCTPVDRPLAEDYAELYGTVEIGNRGGIRVPGFDLSIPLEAE